LGSASTVRRADNFVKLWKDNCGAVATEYAFVLAFISIVAAAGMAVMGTSLSSFYEGIGTALSEISCAMPENSSDKGKGNSNRCKDKKP
jgi:Flp pilus assembly pilin Flp